MARIEKTVFISYRRTNVAWTLAIYQNLKHNGFDVFYDFSGLASGDFESVILENIKSRAHFLVLLTPSALERCKDPSDLLRREVETALDTKRNIVALMLDGFKFDSPGIGEQLTGKLTTLKSYNALYVPVDYFEEAMDRLRTRFLNVAVEAILHPLPAGAIKTAKEQQEHANAAPPVTEKELTAEEWFERAFRSETRDEQIRFYTRAIELKPDYFSAYYNRALARGNNGDIEGAFVDFDEAIRLKADEAEAFYGRGVVRFRRDDYSGAFRDYTEAIRLKPDYAEAINNRGVSRFAMNDIDGAVRDYDAAIRLKPDYVDALINRGIARYRKSDFDGAVQDYDAAIGFNPDRADALNNRGNAFKAKGELDRALRDYDRAITLQPDAVLLRNRGLVRKELGDLEGAQNDFTEADRRKIDIQ